MISRKEVTLCAIVLIGFALRLFALDTRPLWYDEAFSVLLAEQNLSSIIHGTAADVQPPLYYFLLHFWQIFGEQPFTLRFLSVALSMIALALVYFVARRLFSRHTAEFALFFSGIASFQIYHAQELRMYSLLTVGLLLYLYGVSQITQPRLRYWMLAVLGALIALYAQTLAVFTLLAANVYFLFQRDGRAQLKLLGAQLVALIAFVPWLLYLPSQIENIQRAYWTQPPGIADILQMLMVFTTYLPLPPMGLASALFLTLAIFALATFELVRAFRRGVPPAFGLVLAFALVPPVLMFTLSYLVRPIFVPRGVIVSSLAYYILLAYLVARVPRAGKIAIVGIAGIIALTLLPFYYAAFGEWRRAPFAETNQFLRAHAQADDLILHDNKLSFFPMHFYDRALPQQFLADPPGSSNDTLARVSQEAMGLFPIEFDVAVRGRARVWFVIFQTALEQAAQDGRAHGNLSRLDALMQRGDMIAFGDLRIYRYEVQ